MLSEEEQSLEKLYHRTVPTFEDNLGVSKDANTSIMSTFEHEAFKVKFSHCAMYIRLSQQL